jgi:hypothetical protein
MSDKLKAKECARNYNIPFKASHGWCEKFMRRTSLSLRQTKMRRTIPLELNRLNFTILLLDYTVGTSILEFKFAVQTKLQFFSTCLAIIPQISKGSKSGNENPKLQKVACYCHAVHNHRWQ